MHKIKNNLLYTFIAIFLLVKCSKEDESEIIILADEPEIQLFSCVDYTKADDSNLMSYWNLFVEDVKCSRGGPDYSEINTSVNIKFDVLTPEQFASGVSPDHAGYSTFGVYCSRSAVVIGVILDYWEDYTETQRLWLMYHEFGHDVYKYEHSSGRSDIMWPSVPGGNVKINDFITAKNNFLRRDFSGISYIRCPGD